MSSLLIDAHSLARQLATPDAHIRVIDCRSKLQAPGWGRQQYLAGHIPGAIHADLEQDLSGPITPGVTGRHPLPEPAALAATFARFGIDPETLVIAYDDAGGVYASRLWWLLRWLGHDKCVLLDGGLPAWLAAQFTLETDDVTVERRAFIGELQAGLTVSTAELIADMTDATNTAASEQRQHTLIDVRGAARYAGKEEPIDPVAGHIPGAINLPFSGNLDHDGKFLPAAALRSRYAGLGRNPVSYCGSGVTACHAIVAMTLAGLPPAKLYPGSWSEWITDPNRPIGRQPG